MEKLKSIIKETSLKKRILCIVLSVAVFVTGIVYFGNSMNNANAADSDKEYINYLADRVMSGMQDSFTILEIVPYTGQGEFRYFTGEQEIIDGFESYQELLADVYRMSGYRGRADEMLKINSYPISNLGYSIMYNSSTGKYEVQSDERFLNYVIPEYREVFEDRLKVNTVEANDITAADIQNADLIIVSSNVHDGGTWQVYRAYTEGTYDSAEQVIKAREFFNADGTASSSCSYDTYEKLDDGTYVTRDMSWDMCEKLLDVIMCGRELDLPDGSSVTVKTPVVMDHRDVSALNYTGNMYKMLYIYRMLEENGYNILKEHMSTTYTDESGATQYYLNSKGQVTVAIDTTGNKSFTADATLSWNIGDHLGNPIRALFTNLGMENGDNNYDDTDYNYCERGAMSESEYLTDNYWIFKGTSTMIPVNTSQTESRGEDNGFEGRVEDADTSTSDMEVSAVTILRYLLGAKDTYTYNEPKYSFSIKILEVQPCNSFDYDTFEEAKALAESMNMSGTDQWTEANYKSYIDIDCVTTNTLNGMTDDLISQYDMIIIGENIELLTKDDSGKTIYNDRNLNGFVYLAYGDLIKQGSFTLGYLPEDYIVYTPVSHANNAQWTVEYGLTGYTPRHSIDYSQPFVPLYWDSVGTLSNQYKYNSLFALSVETKNLWNDYIYDELYSDGGQGKIFVIKNAADYYRTDLNLGYTNGSYSASTGNLYLDYSLANARLADNDITDISKEKLLSFAQAGKIVALSESLYNVDKTVVYPTSDMCDLLEQLAATDDAGKRVYNILKTDSLKSVYTLMNNSIPVIEIVSAPVSAVASSSHDLDGFINTFNGRDLNYTMNISGIAGATYKVQLFIDKNGDSVYKEIDGGLLDDRNEVFFTDYITMPDSGACTYTINSELSDTYVGFMGWKIEVTQVIKNGVIQYDDTVYSSSVTGYTAIKNDGDPKKIHVLQILPTSQFTNWDINLNLETNEFFLSQLDDIASKVGYEIIVETMYTYEYEELFNPTASGSNSYTKTEDLNTSKDRLKDYDMVILGFADLYGSDDISNVYGAVDNITDFISIGKAVLFTHDTISYSVSTNWAAMSSYDSSRLLSIKTELSELSESGQWKADDGNVSAITITRELRNLVGMDKYGITLSLGDRLYKEKPTYASGLAPNYDSDTTVNELQGFSSWALYTTGMIQNYSSTYQDGCYTLYPFTEAHESFGNGMPTTTKVSQLNEGQVTMYPYLIDEELTVANTHAQNYELDMEDEDIVVWYTLSDDGSDLAGYYGCTNKDAGNNYYIYSKDNLTYSGAGHSDMSSVVELKLFINTIVKAIAGGNNVPEVIVTNGSVGNGGDYYIYVNSADDAGDYEMDILATDADLISLESANGNLNIVGEFKKAEVYWINPDDEEILIKDYASSSSPLKNGIVDELLLSETSLTSDQLTTIENLVEGTGGAAGTYATFKIVVGDWMGAEDSITVRLVARDLFHMD